MSKIYVLNRDKNKIFEYDSIEDFLNEVIDESFLEEEINEIYDKIFIPVIGDIEVGTLLKRLNMIMETKSDEIDWFLEQIEEELNQDEKSYFYGWILSYDKELLIKD